MYVMYIRRVYGRAFSRSSSLSDGFNKPLRVNNCVRHDLSQNHACLVRWGCLSRGVLFRPLQGVDVLYSKLDVPPLSLSGFLFFLYKS